jgi:Uma2 family endonuclease
MDTESTTGPHEPMSLEVWERRDNHEPGELVGGCLVEEEDPDIRHCLISTWFICTLMQWGEARHAFVFPPGHKLALSHMLGRKVDVAMYHPGVRFPRNGWSSRKPPMLVVEILTQTPRDIRRDRIDKPAEYGRFGVPFYWLVDPENRLIECYELMREGRIFRSAAAAEGHLEVPGFEGLVLDLDDLWSEVDLVDGDPEEEPSEP